MKKIIFFLHYRSGSTFFQSVSGMPWRIAQAHGLTQESKQLYNEWHHSKQLVFLPTKPKYICPVVDNIDTIEEVVQKKPAFDYFAWHLHVGHWWGQTDSKTVPPPYQLPDSYGRYDRNYINKLPGQDWTFLSLMRDGRNQVSSLFNFKGGIEEQRRKENADDYFAFLCKAWSNQARLALDCQKEFSHYKIFRFEDLMANPVEYISEIFQYAGLTADQNMIEYNIKLARPAQSGHSSFHTTDQINNRWHDWSDKQISTFKKHAAKELEEMEYTW